MIKLDDRHTALFVESLTVDGCLGIVSKGQFYHENAHPFYISRYASHAPDERENAGFFKNTRAHAYTPGMSDRVSAHWEAVHPQITTTSQPDTIHYFYGPQALFEMTYTTNSDPVLARDALKLIKDSGFDAGEDPERGLDHGA